MHWYCVQTKPGKELHAAAYVAANLGVATFFPQIREERIVRRVRRLIRRPLFPRYFFCQIDPARGSRAIRFAPDVIDIVSFGGMPAPVPAGIIDQLRAWDGAPAGENTDRPELHEGDQVKIASGPLKGLDAVVLQGRTDSARVAVLLHLLQGGATITIDRTQLART